jgi:hypothetical protein
VGGVKQGARGRGGGGGWQQGARVCVVVCVCGGVKQGARVWGEGGGVEAGRWGPCLGTHVMQQTGRSLIKTLEASARCD